MENHHFDWIVPLKIVFFHSYVKLPEGTDFIRTWGLDLTISGLLSRQNSLTHQTPSFLQWRLTVGQSMFLLSSLYTVMFYYPMPRSYQTHHGPWQMASMTSTLVSSGRCWIFSRGKGFMMIHDGFMFPRSFGGLRWHPIYSNELLKYCYVCHYHYDSYNL